MALPNILSKEVCPEFLQGKATPSTIFKSHKKIIDEQIRLFRNDRAL